MYKNDKKCSNDSTNRCIDTIINDNVKFIINKYIINVRLLLFNSIFIIGMILK